MEVLPQGQQRLHARHAHGAVAQPLRLQQHAARKQPRRLRRVRQRRDGVEALAREEDRMRRARPEGALEAPLRAHREPCAREAHGGPALVEHGALHTQRGDVGAERGLGADVAAGVAVAVGAQDGDLRAGGVALARGGQVADGGGVAGLEGGEGGAVAGGELGEGGGGEREAVEGDVPEGEEQQDDVAVGDGGGDAVVEGGERVAAHVGEDGGEGGEDGWGAAGVVGGAEDGAGAEAGRGEGGGDAVDVEDVLEPAVGGVVGAVDDAVEDHAAHAVGLHRGEGLAEELLCGVP